MEILKQVEAMIAPFELIVENMKQGAVSAGDIAKVEATVKDLNYFLYHSDDLKFQRAYHVEEAKDTLLHPDELAELLEKWKQTIARRRTNKIDAEFWEMYEYFKYVEEERIYQNTIAHFLSLPQEKRERFVKLEKSYPFLEHGINDTTQDYSLIKQHVELMVNQAEKFKWLYERLGDYRSKAVLVGIVRYWFQFDEDGLHSLNELLFSDYFDFDIVTCDSNTVLVDLGAYVGDTIKHFVREHNEYKKIYAYEITPSTYQILCQQTADYHDIIRINKGVSKEPGKMFVWGWELGGANKLTDAGDVEVEVVTLDDDIREPVSIIKMDIEGAEKDALIGAKRHIKEERPKLLISAYHLPGDIFEIPELIDSMRDDYKFYLRYNGKKAIWPCDYVLFAV